jgi:iron(III) transport system ATP-binding protein
MSGTPVTCLLELDRVSICYGRHVAVRDVTLNVRAGEIACLLGPSGCGKTTLLRAIAGFQALSAGNIALRDRVISTSDYSLAPEQRRVGMVFQDFALFPHLDVRRNIAFGLHRLARDQRRRRVEELLCLVGLADSARAMPHQLSGGQQQRVALARALAPQPDILLLDEPFSSLDSELREELAGEVRDLLVRNGTTAVLVTHDQQEAFAMADKVALLRAGSVVQTATPRELYAHPANAFVAGFIGQGAIIDVTVSANGQLSHGLGVWGREHSGAGPLRLLLRPEDVRYDPQSALRLKVAARRFCGGHSRYQLQLPDGQQISALTPPDVIIPVDETLPVHINLDHAVVVAAE